MILQELHEIFQRNAELFTIVGFLAGALVGNYLSIERDRRKEFNEIVSPLYFSIKGQIETRAIGIDSFNIDVVEHHLPLYRQSSFRKSAERLKQIQNTVSEYNAANGRVTVNEVEHAKMLKYAKDVLRYIEPR